MMRMIDDDDVDDYDFADDVAYSEFDAVSAAAADDDDGDDDAVVDAYDAEYENRG